MTGRSKLRTHRRNQAETTGTSLADLKIEVGNRVPNRQNRAEKTASLEKDVEEDANEEIENNDCGVVAYEFDDCGGDEFDDCGGEEMIFGDGDEFDDCGGGEFDGCGGGDESEQQETRMVLATHFGDVADEDVRSDDSGDDIWDEENIPDPFSSSEDEEEEERRYNRTEEESPEEILALGKTFGCAADFKNALLRYSLKTRYDIKLYMSTQRKLGAICSYEADLDKDDEPCVWRCYCGYEKRKHKLQIKVYQSKHTCIRSGYSKMLKSGTIAQLYDEKLRLNPKFTALEMADDIQRIYGLKVSVEQCRKAKTKITRSRRTSHEAHFARIWDYEAEVLQRNPGTTMEIETIPGAKPGSKQRFDRLYVCFDAQRAAWKSFCRPIIGLDGAFLKWDVKGQLLAAVGRDGDNRIVPIAWAVVEIENDVNWDWFIKHITHDLDLGDGRDYTIISDKQKGLVKAVHNVLPQCEHRMCARHILGNWKRDSHDPELERIFWKIARSYTRGDYEDNLRAMEIYSQVAHTSLLKTNPETWSRAFFKLGSYCNDNLNNLSESFNRTIKQARKKPLLELLEDVRQQCMNRHARRSVLANRLKTKFTKSAHREIELANKQSNYCIRRTATGNLHEVELNGCAYVVDMNLKTCGCGKWQLVGIPCAHAMKVIIDKKQKVDEYVSEFYTTRVWRLTYERGIAPVQGMKEWPRLNRLPVLPPPNRLGNRGRPRNYDRKKSANETTSKKMKLSREHRIMTCSNCKEDGHNKLTCSKSSVEPPPKRARGRPRKQEQEGRTQLGSQLGSQEASQVLL